MLQRERINSHNTKAALLKIHKYIVTKLYTVHVKTILSTNIGSGVGYSNQVQVAIHQLYRGR